MTKKKFVGVRMSDDILVRIKKMAGDQGRSVSETVGMLVVKSLESGPGTDIEAFKKAIRELRKEGEDEEKYQITLAELGLESLKTPPSEGLSPEVVRYQVETLAKLESILAEIVRDRPMGEGKIKDWMKAANTAAETVLKNLRMRRA